MRGSTEYRNGNPIQWLGEERAAEASAESRLLKLAQEQRMGNVKFPVLKINKITNVPLTPTAPQKGYGALGSYLFTNIRCEENHADPRKAIGCRADKMFEI